MLRVALVGPLVVQRDGRNLRIPIGKASELLVRLALEAGTPVSAERLIEDLWGRDAATTRANTLQSKITMLRRAFGSPPVLESRAGGYALSLAPLDVDALQVMEHVAQASELLSKGQLQETADLSAAALALFRGELLPAAGDGEWADQERRRLGEARSRLLEMRFTAVLGLGDTGDVIGELEAAVADHPFHEALWELLVTALYQAGRQVDALATYQRAKAKLADELGLDPGPGLRRLEAQILAQDGALDSAPRLQATKRLRIGNLPSLTSALVGREQDTARLLELLSTDRLVEVVGVGGVGKTALAVAVGQQLSASDHAPTGGTWLARLETAASANEAMDVLIAALQVPGDEAALLRLLDLEPALLILDNCEHVLDVVSDLVVRLLDQAPSLRILCTSQVALGLPGEALFEVAPLALPDAVELFEQRAAAQRKDTAPAFGEDVATLCRSLDGLPLAIELAAARTKTLSVRDITRRLANRFHVLSDPTTRKPERRRSLRSTIRWSYDLLFPDDQRGLWALATFSGGAPLSAVEHVLEALDVPTDAALDVLSRLASRSLVIVDVDGTSPHGEFRYRLLDSIRAFAAESMADAAATDRAFAAHAEWYARAARASTAGVRSKHQADHLALARRERANIDAALGWAADHQPLLGLEIATGLGWAWVVLGDSRGSERIMNALAAAGDGGAPTDRATALLLAGWIEASSGRLDEARDRVAAATKVAEELGGPELRARCISYRAYVVSHSGEFARALELTERAQVMYDELDLPWDRAANDLLAARAALSVGDLERSIAAVARVDDDLRAVRDPWLHVRGEAARGELARILGRFEDAVVHLSRAADTSDRLGFAQTAAYQLTILGRAQCQGGDYDAGCATLAAAIDRASATGDLRLVALTRVHMGRALRASGRLPEARAALEAATGWQHEAGGGELALQGDCLLAALDAAELCPGSHGRLHSLLDQAKSQQDSPVEVLSLDALGRLAAAEEDLELAEALLASADTRMAAASSFISEVDRVDAAEVRRLLEPAAR